jgi:hypothetical protein
MVAQYEFTSEQNTLIGGLANKMRFVGLFAVVLGVVNLLIAILAVVAIYQDRLPAEWKSKTKEYVEKAREKLPDDVKKQAEDYSLDKLPANNHLWGIALNLGVTGLFFLLMGAWTRSAGASFQKIVTTQGSDITHLMNGLGSLHSMYSLLYTLLVVTLLFGLFSILLTLYQNFAGR